MKRTKAQKLFFCSALFLGGMIGISGCPDTSRTLLAQPDQPEVIPAVQSSDNPVKAVGENTPRPVEFDICGQVADWQRPDLSEQSDVLAENPRYGEALNEEPLKSLSEKFWNESIFTFTTFGLSARAEPVYLSGVWTAIESMDACYVGDRADAINRGEMAEMWLVHYRIVDFAWTGQEYQVTVEADSQGLQFVQFNRMESGTTLPIVVLEATGDEVSVASGDW